jgi:hypothetical protein
MKSVAEKSQERATAAMNVAREMFEEDNNDVRILTMYFDNQNPVEDDPFARVIKAADRFITGDLKFGSCVPDEYRILVYALAKYKLEKIGKQIIR